MANHKQAIKRVRQTATRTERNKALRSRVRGAVKQVEQAIESGDKKAIPAAFTTAMSELHKAVTKGIMKQGTASRKISRLSSRVKAVSAK